MLNNHNLESHRQKQVFARRTKKAILFKHQNNQIQTNDKNAYLDNSYLKILRSKSPSKKSRQSRSLSKKQRLSKDSKFSSKDIKMTRQMSNQKPQRVNRVEYTMNNRQGRINDSIKNNQLKNVNNHQFNHLKDKRQIKQVAGKVKNASSKSRNKMFKIQRKISQQKYINRDKNKQMQELQTLRQQNQYVKIVYKSSVQKMRRLQEHLQNQKNEYQFQRKKYQREINQLKNRMKSQKKVNLGHIYSYDDKSLLEVKVDNIIIETDREDSSYMQQSRKKENPSKLSLHSKMYEN